MKTVLLVKAGEASNAVRLIAGDYDRWFLQTASRPNVRFERVNACLGEPLPSSARGFDGVLVTGSPLSATTPAPWMWRTAELMRAAGDAGVPVLGVCFGHQLLGLAYGGRVAQSPRGREIGTVEVELSAAGRQDWLFEGVPARFAAQTTHEDEVPQPPAGAVVLARNAFCAVQAMGFGKHVRGVQFHPEMPTDGMRAVVAARAPALEADARRRGLVPGYRVTALLAGIRPAPFAVRVLQNFVSRL